MSETKDNEVELEEVTEPENEGPELEEVFDDEEEPQAEDCPTKELLKQIEALQSDAENFKTEALRQRAELENFRKRMQREKDDLRKIAAGGVIEELLPVLDNLKLGLRSAEQHPEAKVVTDGFKMVASQLQTTLSNHGLKEISPKGEDFDPNFHECVSQQSSEELPEDKVIDVIRSGYTLNGRLIRAAHVIISTGPESGDKDEEKPAEDPGV